MIIIEYFSLLIVLLFSTFVFLCAILKLREVNDAGLIKDSPMIVKEFAYLTLLIGLISDFSLNILFSIFVFDMPNLLDKREWLTTGHVSRLKKTGSGWAKSCAVWLCTQLDNLDNNHCG